jgi:photosystem II stability/assembly factor-like uncharacterized protein
MLYRLLFLLLFLISPIAAFCQSGIPGSKWEMVGFINFTSIARQSSTTVVATTRHGYLYFSTNNGSSWDRRELNDTLNLTDIAFLDSLHVVVTDQANHIMFSTNGGFDWRYSQLPISISNNTSIAYPGTDTVFVSNTFNEIWRTTDAGISWKEQKQQASGALNKLYFLTRNTGFAAGDNGVFLKTTDAGDHWSPQNIILGDTNNLYTIEFYGANRGIIGGDGHFYTTSDAGIHWKIHVMSTAIRGPLYVVKLMNDTEFFALGFSGQVYHSSNFGDTLGVMLLDSIADADYTRGAIYDKKNGAIAVGDRALIMRSMNGRYWNPINQCPELGPMESLGNGMVHCGTTLPILSTDGGVFWNGYYFQNELDFIGLHFTSRDSGFLINSFNYDWLRTFDNGRTWTVPVFQPSFPILSIASGGYNSYSFYGRNSGYVAGDTIILHTSDNGITWNTFKFSFDRTTPFIGNSIPHDWIINQVQAVDEHVGYTKLDITDSIPNPINGGLNYGNYHSQLLKTIDGGNTWTTLPNAPRLPQILHLAFSSNNTGYLGCDSNIIYKTTDGGNSWSRSQYSTIPHNFIYGFRFLNDSVGFMSLRFGGVFSTIDGGKTWLKEDIRHPSSYPTISMNDFIFPDSNTVLGIAGGSSPGFFKKILTLKKDFVHIDFTGNPQQYMYIVTYPNPSTGIIHCEFDGMYVDPSGNLSAAIYDILGRQVMDISALARSGNNGTVSMFSVDAGKLPVGVYTVRYRLGTLSYAKQIMIVR